MNKLYTILLLIQITIIYSCANIITPDGGNTDKISPKIKHIVFNEKSIIITYTEIVNLKNNPIIYPKTEYKIYHSSKIVHIDFTTNIDTSTSYLIMLPALVSDITEGNTAQDTSIIFSCNNITDTATYKINVNSLNEDKNKYYLAGYEKDNNDSIYIDKLNLYFQIELKLIPNILKYSPNKELLLLVYEDINNNKQPDPNEPLDYITDFINLKTSTIKEYTFNLLVNNSLFTTRIVSIKSNHYGEFEIIYFPSSYNFKLINNNIFTEKYYTLYKQSNYGDTIRWFDPSADFGEGHFDLYVNSYYHRDLTANHLNNTYFTPKLNINPKYTDTSYTQYDTISFEVSTPIESLYSEQISVKNSKGVTISKTIYLTNDYLTEFNIVFNSLPGENYIINIGKGALNDIYTQKNDSFLYTVSYVSDTLYGDLDIKLNDNSKKAIYVINTKNQKITYIGSSSKRVKLPQGIYKILYSEDLNNNHIIDIASFMEKKISERYTMLDGYVDITWKNEQKITINDK